MNPGGRAHRGQPTLSSCCALPTPQAPDHADVPKFLKGLCVVDDIAYFGINVWGGRADRDSVSLDGEGTCTLWGRVAALAAAPAGGGGVAGALPC